MVRILLLRFSASLTTTEFWRSKKGKVVEAKYKEERSISGFEQRQLFAASTAIVMESSSQLQIARSPLPNDLRLASNQELASAIACLLSRPRGM